MNNLYHSHMFGGGFWMVLFWIGIIFLFIWIVKEITKSNSNEKEDETPLKILKERYAKGEINKEEFEEKKKDIKN
ncbi:MAG: SHOCT domain-containing protein [Candidatus Paceibacterota bacterium]